MPEKITIRMVHDQTGKTEDATLDTLAKYQAQGFRVDNVNAYNRAIQEREAAAQEAARKINPVNDNLHAQEDAALITARTYPDAPGGFDGGDGDGESAEDAVDVSDAQTTDEEAEAQAQENQERVDEKALAEAKAEKEARAAAAAAGVENTAGRRAPTRTRRG